MKRRDVVLAAGKGNLVPNSSFVRWDKISKLGPFFFQHVIKMVLSSESESRAIE